MTDLRPTLLPHILNLAPFDGWSDYTLREAAHRAGLSAEEATRAFPGGAQEAIHYYFEQVDAALAAQHPADSLAKTRVPERIKTLVLARLAMMLPHREAVKRAASAQLLPWNTSDAYRSLFTMTDMMWRLAGDNATDFNHYTKRLTLAGVYTSTFLFWLNDSSPDMKATEEFLLRRLAGVAAFGKKKKALLSRLHVFSYYTKR